MPKEPQWRTSSYSDGLQCVETAALGDVIGVRDSKDPQGGVLRFTRDEWKAFLQGAKAGKFDNMA